MITYIEEYNNKLQSGEIVACRKIKVIYEYLVYCLHHDMVDFEFDIKLATKPIDFIETFCRHTQGRKIGAPLELELFQKARRQAVFGFVEKSSKYRQYTETMTIEGRKNGKTTENACDQLYMLVGDGEGSAEIYSVATKKDQAEKCYFEARKMISLDETLNKYLVNGVGEISFPSTFSFIKALSSKDLDSLNAHFVVIDELAAIQKRSIYDDMKQSTSSRDQGLISSISTNNFVRDNIFDSQYAYASDVIDFMEDFLRKAKKFGHEEIMKLVKEQDETGIKHFAGVIDFHFLPFIYELDDRNEWDKEELWIKANPGLGTIKKLKVLRDFVKKAKSDAGFKPTVMVKDFNMKENPINRWLKWEDLENEALINLDFKPKGDDFNYNTFAKAYKEMGFRYGIGGFDYAETFDLAAAKFLCMRKDDPRIYVLQMYWMPEDAVDKKEEEEHLPYRLWVSKGFIRTSQGYKIRKTDIFDWFEEIQNELGINIIYGAHDRWHVTESDVNYLNGTYGPITWTGLGMGAKTLSAPMYELKEDLKNKIIVYNDNPIDKVHLSNTEIIIDTNDNIKPVKPGYGDKNAVKQYRKHIDGSLALLIPYARLKEKWDEYQSMI